MEKGVVISSHLFRKDERVDLRKEPHPLVLMRYNLRLQNRTRSMVEKFTNSAYLFRTIIMNF